MVSDDNKKIINIEDIESKIILLKRRAREADFLREERDMLIQRLKLYADEYFVPEPKNPKALIEENEALSKKNEELVEEVENLKREIETLDDFIDGVMTENDVLKQDIAKLSDLEVKVKVLSEEKEFLKAEFDSTLSAVDKGEPETYRKIQQLSGRTVSLREERDKLYVKLMEREVRIDTLLGKISQMESRLAERLVSARLKTRLGQELEPEEAVLWKVSKLEAANRAMAAELEGLSTKVLQMKRAGAEVGASEHGGQQECLSTRSQERKRDERPVQEVQMREPSGLGAGQPLDEGEEEMDWGSDGISRELSFRSDLEEAHLWEEERLKEVALTKATLHALHGKLAVLRARPVCRPNFRISFIPDHKTQ